MGFKHTVLKSNELKPLDFFPFQEKFQWLGKKHGSLTVHFDFLGSTGKHYFLIKGFLITRCIKLRIIFLTHFSFLKAQNVAERANQWWNDAALTNLKLILHVGNNHKAFKSNNDSVI